jgi:hypothetical protein
MELVKRLGIEFRGERIEITAGLITGGAELRELKDMVRLEYQRRGYISADLASFDDEYDATSLYFGTSGMLFNQLLQSLGVEQGIQAVSPQFQPPGGMPPNMPGQ